MAIALMGIPLTGDKCSLLAPDRLNEENIALQKYVILTDVILSPESQ